jgi:hypothetical protein
MASKRVSGLMLVLRISAVRERQSLLAGMKRLWGRLIVATTAGRDLRSLVLRRKCLETVYMMEWSGGGFKNWKYRRKIRS